MLGVIILDKPPGRSSNQALGAVKRLLGETKLGFVGTLDPLATGVLPIFVGKATKLIPHFEGLSKRYQVTCKLGESTDTLDADGQVTARADVSHLTADRVRQAILAHAGQQWQTVPRYAAVKVQGVPAYKLARQGREVPEQQRQVNVWDLQVQEVALPLATFSLSCGAGTYVRSLVQQIGQELGVGAHVQALRRLACGNLFTLENSITLDEIDRQVACGNLHFLRNPAQFLTDFLPLTVGAEAERELKDGRTIPLEAQAWMAGLGAGETPAEPLRIKALRPDGALLAVGRSAPGMGGLAFQPTQVLI